MTGEVEDTRHATLNRDRKVALIVDCAICTADNICHDISCQKSCLVPILKGDRATSAKNAVVGEDSNNLRAIEAFPHGDGAGVIVDHTAAIGYVIVGGFDSLCTEDVKGRGEYIEW